jgi:integrase
MTTDQKKESRHPGIRKMVAKNGDVKYRLIIDMGERPDGKRDQRCETFNRLGDAKARQAEIKDGRRKGNLVKPSKITLGKAIDDWLAGRRNLRPSTQRSYRDSLELAKARIGHIQLQGLTKARLDALVTELLKSGRRIGNVQRQGLSPRSVNQMLTLLGSVLDAAMRDGLVVRNVAKLVEHPRQPKKEM